MSAVLGHAILIASLTMGVAYHAIYAARRHLPNSAPQQVGVLVAAGTVVCVAASAAITASLLVPDRVLYGDALRYYDEIIGIAKAPWLWNPVTGEGADGYRATPKMGMSYLYGWILGIHQAASLVGILALNVAMMYVTAYTVFLLTLRLTGHATAATWAMAMVGLYPETLFWVIRPARENFALPLVTMLAYAGVMLFSTQRLRWLLAMAVITGVLALTRAQLALFTGLIFAYYGFAIVCRVLLYGRLNGAGIILVMLVAGLAALPLVADQIRAAAGSAILNLLFQIDIDVWMELFTDRAGEAGARLIPQGYGGLGLLMAPVVVLFILVVLGTLLRFRRIFGDGRLHAGMLVFLVAVFLVALALSGSANIRFRSTVAPLLLAIAAPGAVYYWRVCGGIRRVMNVERDAPTAT